MLTAGGLVVWPSESMLAGPRVELSVFRREQFEQVELTLSRKDFVVPLDMLQQRGVDAHPSTHPLGQPKRACRAWDGQSVMNTGRPRTGAAGLRLLHRGREQPHSAPPRHCPHGGAVRRDGESRQHHRTGPAGLPSSGSTSHWHARRHRRRTAHRNRGGFCWSRQGLLDGLR